MDKKINVNDLGEKIVKMIKTIFDPEIPVDIYELGLIYDVFVNEDFDVKILRRTNGFVQRKTTEAVLVCRECPEINRRVEFNGIVNLYL